MSSTITIENMEGIRTKKNGEIRRNHTWQGREDPERNNRDTEYVYVCTTEFYHPVQRKQLIIQSVGITEQIKLEIQGHTQEDLKDNDLNHYRQAIDAIKDTLAAESIGKEPNIFNADAVSRPLLSLKTIKDSDYSDRLIIGKAATQYHNVIEKDEIFISRLFPEPCDRSDIMLKTYVLGGFQRESKPRTRIGIDLVFGLPVADEGFA
ncbi:hypothetical protein BpHYR1_050317 [Brachionus plicatilis]|uniref:Uncharacterized protein n=1 Tax=Brachionus plicatilis TaxID=10195 RepID=A0A3M7SCR5_BRAPC|nr:hypothetical protein BpHYR1_050317 [Brachionus plicatilis]